MADSTSTSTKGLPNAMMAMLLQSLLMPGRQQQSAPSQGNIGAGYGNAGRSPDPESTMGSPPGMGGGGDAMGGYYFAGQGDNQYLMGPGGAVTRDGQTVNQFPGLKNVNDMVSQFNLVTPSDVQESMKDFVTKLVDQVNQPKSTASDPLSATPETKPIAATPPAPAPARQPTSFAQLPTLPTINPQTLGTAANQAANNPNLMASSAPSAGNRADINVPSYQPAQVPQPPTFGGGVAAIASPVQSVVPQVNPAQRQYVYQSPSSPSVNMTGLPTGVTGPIVNSIGAQGTPYAGSPVTTGAYGQVTSAPMVGPNVVSSPGSPGGFTTNPSATPTYAPTSTGSMTGVGGMTPAMGSALASGISAAGNAIAQGFAHPAQLNVGALQPPPLLAPYQNQVPYRIGG